MDVDGVDTFDATNPYFKYEVDKFCAICTNKLEKNKTHAINADIETKACDPIKAYEVLESTSRFQLSKDGPQLLCLTCFNNTVDAYTFQQMCNKAQLYFNQYTKHQQLLLAQKQDSNDIETEEIEIRITPPSHERSVNAGPRKLQCKVCHKFHRSYNMKAHMRTHTGEKPYKCKLCDAAFAQGSSLQYHVNAHENRRGYVCRFCGKAYNTNSALRVHERSHTGERPHQCKDCDLAFITKENLKRHTVVHTKEKAFTCEYCAKSYNRRSTLRVHLKIHTGDRPHVCHWCGKSFIQRQSLKGHLQTHANKLILQTENLETELVVLPDDDNA